MDHFIEDLIVQYNLIPLDHEGGFFRRVLDNTEQDNQFSLIYYLMTDKSFSALHKLTIHEIWTFISGDPIEQIVIDENKKVTISTLGGKNQGDGVSHIYPNLWQASRIKEGGIYGYSLCTTTCIPSYRQEDFSLATSAMLQEIVDANDFKLVNEFLATS